jgi:hypothetical protein
MWVLNGVINSHRLTIAKLANCSVESVKSRRGTDEVLIMNLLPDASWLNALEKINARTAAIIGLFGTAGLIAAAYEWPAPAPSALKWIFATSAFLGYSAIIAHTVAYVSRLLANRRANQIRERDRLAAQEVVAEQQRAVLRNLDTIGQDATITLDWFVDRGQQMLPARIDQPELVTLVASGLVERCDGEHNILRWPHRIPDFVWNELIRRRAENPQRRGPRRAV